MEANLLRLVARENAQVTRSHYPGQRNARSLTHVTQLNGDPVPQTSDMDMSLGFLKYILYLDIYLKFHNGRGRPLMDVRLPPPGIWTEQMARDPRPRWAAICSGRQAPSKASSDSVRSLWTKR